MSWGQIGAVLIALVIVFIVGHLWFHIVEGVLGGLKRLSSRKKEPPAWPPLPPDADNADKEETKHV